MKSTLFLLAFIIGMTSNALAFYNPSTGRWLSRDPVNEFGFKLVIKTPLRSTRIDPSDYCFIRNNPNKYFDVLGLKVLEPDGSDCCNNFRLPHSHYPYTCDEICAQAASELPFYVALGGVICFGNKACPCLGPHQNLGYKPGICPAIDNIIMQHEQAHVTKARCTKCGLHPAEPLPGIDWDAEECEQRKKTLEQLVLIESSLESPCSDVALNLIEEEIRSIENCP